jgi:hypothetical protein
MGHDQFDLAALFRVLVSSLVIFKTHTTTPFETPRIKEDPCGVEPSEELYCLVW